MCCGRQGGIGWTNRKAQGPWGLVGPEREQDNEKTRVRREGLRNGHNRKATREQQRREEEKQSQAQSERPELFQ